MGALEMINLRSVYENYHNSTNSFADLLPWYELITDQLVINQDGSLLACFALDGLDKFSSSKEEFDSATKYFENALKLLNHKNSIWSIFDKRNSKIEVQSKISNAIGNFIESEWIKSLNDRSLSSLNNYLYISYSPDLGDNSSIESWQKILKNFFSRVRAGFSYQSLLDSEIQIIDEHISEFENQLDSFEKILDILNIKRLSKNNFLLQLSNRVNLASCSSIDTIPKDIKFSLNQSLLTNSIKRIDNGILEFIDSTETKYVTILTVKGYPNLIDNGDIEKILNIQGQFSIVQAYKILSREESKSLLMKKEQYYRSKVKSPIVQMMEKISGVESSRVDLGQLSLANDSRDALISMSEVANNFGFHTMSIVIIAKTLDELGKTRKSISEVIGNLGFGLIREVIHQIGAFMSSIPGARDLMMRSSLISISNLAHLILVRSINSGLISNQYLSEQRCINTPYLCMMPTVSGVPEYFNFHVGDVGHFLIVGQSGGGKTTLINFLMVMWQKYAPCKTIILDKDKSCYLTVKALGGHYINLSDVQNNANLMNPLHWLIDSSKLPTILSWIVGLMTSFDDSKLTPHQFETLNQALKMLSRGLSKAMTISHLKQMLEGMDLELASRLSPWVKDFNNYNVLGSLFDNPIDTFCNSFTKKNQNIICVDVSSLLENPIIAKPTIEYILLCIDSYVDGQTPSFIYLEEAWYLLKDKRFSHQFENWIKTMRKKMAVVGMSTQSVDDIKKMDISATLNDNIKTKIFLPNLQVEASFTIYQDFFGLRKDHIEIIKNMKPKKNYLIWQDSRVRVVDADLPNNVLALTRSDTFAIKKFQDLFESEGLHAYLKSIRELN